MSKAGVGSVLSAIVLASFTSIGTASAQSQVVQTITKEQAARQSTNQIVGGAEQKPLEAKPAAPPQNSQKPTEPQVEVGVENAVIPPAPVIVKKSSNTIMIPVDGAVAASKANSETKYEERPAISSSVSVGSIFGYRRDPFTGRAKFHSGVDLKAR